MRKLFLGLPGALILLLAPAAHAVPTVDFGLGVPYGSTGSISYGGGTSALVGSNIVVGNTTGLLTPVNNGTTRLVNGGKLNFMTGARTNTGPTYTFGAGTSTPPSVLITGAVDLSTVPDGDTTDPEDIGTGGTLLSGQILSASVFPAGQSFMVTVAVFINTINTKLATFFGLPSSPGFPYNGGFNLSFMVPSNTAAGGPFASTSILSGDGFTTPAPEPSTLLIGGIGIVGMALINRRRGKLAAEPLAA